MSSTFKLRNQFEAHSNYVNQAQFMPIVPILVTAGMDNTLKLWSVPRWEALATFNGHENSVNCFFAMSHDRCLVSGSSDKTIRKWNIRSREQIWKIDAHSKTVATLALHPDESVFASGSYDGKAKIWDAESGAPLAEYKDFGRNLTALMFLSGGKRLLGAGLGEEMVVWDTESGSVLQRFPAHAEATARLFLPARSPYLLSAGADRTLKQWNTDTWEVVNQVELPAGGVHPIALTRDESLLAVGCEKRILLYTHPDLTLLTSLHVEVKGVYGLDFSNQDNYLVMGAANRQVYVWQMLDSEENLHSRTFVPRKPSETQQKKRPFQRRYPSKNDPAPKGNRRKP
ncbi:MAG: WD40 repeat domain-containing protein [Anaerolineae bacterium]|nr:WD40 repeat domain-containing protein [Anaerolineae bacterium]